MRYDVLASGGTVKYPKVQHIMVEIAAGQFACQMKQEIG